MKINDQKKFNESLGSIIRKIREEKSLSRTYLADLCGINEKYLGKIERGESSPSGFIIMKIANGLKIEITDIFNKI
jgi:transcriptional regulator with XRE-family HTH domain